MDWKRQQSLHNFSLIYFSSANAYIAFRFVWSFAFRKNDNLFNQLHDKSKLHSIVYQSVNCLSYLCIEQFFIGEGCSYLNQIVTRESLLTTDHGLASSVGFFKCYTSILVGMLTSFGG